MTAPKSHPAGPLQVCTAQGEHKGYVAQGSLLCNSNPLCRFSLKVDLTVPVKEKLRQQGLRALGGGEGHLWVGGTEGGLRG